MERIEVIILDGGKTAREVNPFKDELDKEYALGHNPSFSLLESYRSKEAMLRTFEIDPCGVEENASKEAREFMDKWLMVHWRYISGQRHPAQVLPNGKIKIVG